MMNFTSEMLRAYDGTNLSMPIFVAVKGKVFDVTIAKSFFGPGGVYAAYAGRDASRALAKNYSRNEEDVSPSLDGLTEEELAVLDEWERKFQAEYPMIGRVKDKK